MSPVELKDYIDFEVKEFILLVMQKLQLVLIVIKQRKNCLFYFLVLATAVIDRGNGIEEIKMIGPNSAIYTPAFVWHHFKDFSSDAILLAISSTNYNPDRSDYIENYDEYLKVRDEHLNS